MPGLPAVQDVHRQVLQAFGDQLDGVGVFLTGFAQAIAQRRDRVVERLGVVGPMLQHDQVGGELIEVPAPAAAADVRLDAPLEQCVERFAVFLRQLGDARKVGVVEEGPRWLTSLRHWAQTRPSRLASGHVVFLGDLGDDEIEAALLTPTRTLFDLDFELPAGTSDRAVALRRRTGTAASSAADCRPAP